MTVQANFTRQDPFASDSPDIRDCLDYWTRLRGRRFAPPWPEFDWNEIRAELIPHFGVVDVCGDPLDFVYRFWGSAHVRAHNLEMTGKSVSAMRPKAEADAVFDQYRLTFEAREPLLFENRIHAGRYKVEMLETSLRLPFSDDGKRVHHLVAFSDIRLDMERMVEVFSDAGTA
jgi:hypothetical protein